MLFAKERLDIHVSICLIARQKYKITKAYNLLIITKVLF